MARAQRWTRFLFARTQLGFEPDAKQALAPRSMLFPGGARIAGLPAIEAIDEAPRAQDDLYQALRPMLAVRGGDLWLMSTPCGNLPKKAEDRKCRRKRLLHIGGSGPEFCSQEF